MPSVWEPSISSQLDSGCYICASGKLLAWTLHAHLRHGALAISLLVVGLPSLIYASFSDAATAHASLPHLRREFRPTMPSACGVSVRAGFQKWAEGCQSFSVSL
ncbi:hypothetical protein PLICRDRAFT_39147 [Plicaturopsis crispa FD-325 SS-3]|nr:hypothetical protein PLICRDRAFT_39147 [Plicaturopsis crispa FD-325 SS-3]